MVDVALGVDQILDHRVALDGGDRTVDERVDREVGPDPVDGALVLGLGLVLVRRDQLVDLVRAESAAEVVAGDEDRRGQVPRAEHLLEEVKEALPRLDQRGR